MMESWTRTVGQRTVLYTRNVGEAGSVFTAQVEGEIVVYSGAGQGQWTRAQVEEKFANNVGG